MVNPTNTNCTSLVGQNQSLPDAWADFLRRFEPYGVFATLTFHTDVTEDLAERQYKRWIRAINTELFGRRYREDGLGITHVKCLERTKQGRIHFHCLLDAHTSKLPCDWLDFTWQGLSKSTNGFGRIRPYLPSLGAVGYLGKYVGKGGNVDVFLRPSLYKELHNPTPCLVGEPPYLLGLLDGGPNLFGSPSSNDA
jgi:hypothetical protein